MRLNRFTWPADLYDSEAGLRLATLQDLAAVDALCSHAVRFAEWPAGVNGRIGFHATVAYCLRTGHPPGRLLTSAVASKRYGRYAWYSAGDFIEAARRLGIAADDDTQRVARLTTGEPRCASDRDWNDADGTIERLTDEEAFALLPHEFFRALFMRATLNGKSPRHVPTLRTVLRRAVVAGQRPGRQQERAH